MSHHSATFISFFNEIAISFAYIRWEIEPRTSRSWILCLNHFANTILFCFSGRQKISSAIFGFETNPDGHRVQPSRGRRHQIHFQPFRPRPQRNRRPRKQYSDKLILDIETYLFSSVRKTALNVWICQHYFIVNKQPKDLYVLRKWLRKFF